jgi:hypothetical protein
MLRVPNDGHTDNGTSHGVSVDGPRRATRDLDVAVPGCARGGQQLIDAFKAAVVAADAVAPRFSVREGEALLIDNYRMLHGRDPYAGGRLMWRVWCWTDERMYARLPDVCLCSCGQEYGGTDRGRPLRGGAAWAAGECYVLPPWEGQWHHSNDSCPCSHNEWVCMAALGPKWGSEV